ncbi:serine hydrolase domain-containing protein [Streptomyces sp. NPDC007088]|uniref:serine hydrolase domain-containing protein n=1 Tax=Streptomyces sp. NPDC007088 TaxID=3364773 RepID=UPI0036B8603E
MRTAFAEGQYGDSGAAQLAVHHRGEQVVDLWAVPSPDPREATPAEVPAAGRPFDGDSVGVLMSAGKGVLAVCAHLLAERGLLRLDAPVVHYWPQYGRHGKEHTTVADVLAHRAGLPAFGGGLGVPELYDWDACAGALAAAAPVWTPGSAFLYHPLTFGHLTGELIRRADGRSPGAFLAEEVAGPLGLALWFGLPQTEEYRFVPQFSSPERPPPAPEEVTAALAAAGLDPGRPLTTALLASFGELRAVVEGFGTRRGRAAQLPGAGGIGNARSLSRLYAALLGPVDGVRLLGESTVERARTCVTDPLAPPAPLDRLDGPDRSRFGLGFELPRPGEPLLGPGSFGHAGAGGRLGLAHPESGVSLAYTCTAMSWVPERGPDPRWLPWTRAVRRIVEAGEPGAAGDARTRGTSP